MAQFGCQIWHNWEKYLTASWHKFGQIWDWTENCSLKNPKFSHVCRQSGPIDVQIWQPCLACGLSTLSSYCGCGLWAAWQWSVCRLVWFGIWIILFNVMGIFFIISTHKCGKSPPSEQNILCRYNREKKIEQTLWFLKRTWKERSFHFLGEMSFLYFFTYVYF